MSQIVEGTMGKEEDGQRAVRPEHPAERRLLLWIASLCILACTLTACTTTPSTARAEPPTATGSRSATTPVTSFAPPIPATTIVSTVPAPTGGLVVTVLATDVALWQTPDMRSSHVSVSFTINGNPAQTSVYVSGDLPVLETNIAGADGTSRWTRVAYSGRVGPTEGGTAFTVTGYLRNDLISAPHAPGAPPVRNP
jgi:hypothetical protein